ncbi:MAG TPA: ferrochelatase [Mycobacteriales bacterium]|nr:ferrochelatase [Mycobacteriales bacterium]
MSTPYDALLLLSFGGPEGPDDVMPFLRNVTRGRGIPDERLAAVAEHYLHFGGVSPINGLNRELLAAIRADFAAAGLDLPVYWGNRNWDPYVTDTLRQMSKDGVRRALAFATSAYTSYSGCRQYQDDIAAARAEIGADAPVVDKLRHFFNHPGFIEPAADAVRAALREVPVGARLVFTAHSIPTSMARDSGPDGDLYVTQLTEAARLVTEAVAPGESFDLVWQSRSGPPQVPWLEPDINDHLERLAADGVAAAVVVAPIGFVSDHMEVVWDLDNEAAETARRLGLGYARAGTPGADPRFVAMIRELVLERLDAGCPRRALGPMGPSHDVCPVGCCPAPARRPVPRS